ncbi:MAG: hypothetical protein D6675_04285 [Gemmatimonadetes bacterium]|nr:MAG: hypothetical protein D6675_04285 [Gemmatimonadota bacterium]
MRNTLIFSIGLLIYFAALSWAQVDDDECLMCHSDDSDPALYVDVNQFIDTVHEGFSCTDCHSDIEEIPHAEEVAPANCGFCHDDVVTAFQESYHGQVLAQGDKNAPTCGSCHNHHRILPASHLNAPTHPLKTGVMCGQCHKQDGSDWIHREANTGGKVNCITCHTAHEVQPASHPQSTINSRKMTQTCRKCHTQLEELHAGKVRAEVFQRPVDEIPACTTCHQPHASAKSTDLATETCLACHGEGADSTLYVNHEQLNESIHCNFDCIDCHTSITTLPHAEKLPDADCSFCHEDAVADYEISIHAEGRRAGLEAATCTDCHGAHDIQACEETSAQANRMNLSETCGRCHSRPEVIALFHRKGSDPIENYKQGVHGKKLADDPSATVATCIDCHGSHKILPSTNPESSFNILNISKTCGKCHKEESAEYTESIHWEALSFGHYESPTCNDCHGEHNIISPEAEYAVTHPTLVSTELCAKCHSNELIMSRFGLDPTRFNSYMKTYHGLAILKGSPDAANCTSCHEVHAIRAASDTLSSVHPRNLNETCGKCHENVTANFTQIEMHPRDQKSRNPVAYLIKIIYFWLIGLTIGGMVLHNLIIFLYYVVNKWRKERSQRLVQRFHLIDVINHLLLIVSFTVLVVTGFALKFPEDLWVKALVLLGLTEPIRASLHRMAAVILVISAISQALYFILHPRGRHDLRALRPTINDLTGFFKNMMYYLRLRKDKPKFDRYDYTEKAEYLALIWGTAVMAITGFILWFPAIFMAYLPSWAFEVSEVVHYYEAWLATLAILIWHGFFVFLHPEKYPLSLTWIDGKITEDEFEHHHALEAERLKAKETKESE